MKHLPMLCVFATLGAGAAPVILNDSVQVSMAEGIMKVEYELESPAIVTANVETNAGDGVWVRLPGASFTALQGDVSRMIATSGRKSFKWRAYRDLPDLQLPEGSVRVTVKSWAPNAAPKWLAVYLGASSDAARYYEDDFALPAPPTDDRWKTTSLLMRRIPAALVEWRMGKSPWEAQAKFYNGWEWTQETGHRVTLTKDYYMAVYEMTQYQYVKLTGRSNPSNYTSLCPMCGDDADAVARRPVERVSYAAVTGDGGPLARLRMITGNATFGLPTTAEWEYACRAGSSHALYDGTNDIVLYGITEGHKKLAWMGETGDDGNEFDGNAHRHTHPVGLKLPNAFGLYDTLGNVEEFTRDWHQTDPGSADVVDPEFPVQGEHNYHATCGGHCKRPAYRVRCCAQNGYENGAEICGFRPYCR